MSTVNRDKLHRLFDFLINFNIAYQPRYRIHKTRADPAYREAYESIFPFMDKGIYNTRNLKDRIDEIYLLDSNRADAIYQPMINRLVITLRELGFSITNKATWSYPPSLSIQPRQTTQDQVIYVSPESFKNMTPSQQMRLIRNHWEIGECRGGRRKGSEAAYLRRLCKANAMRLEELFRINRTFMNKTLREFLNVNSRGVDHYTLAEVRQGGTGWMIEIPSFASNYHQSERAGDTKVTRITASFVQQGERHYTTESYYNRLNAKFMHDDGREAIFRCPGAANDYISTGPDRGTYNYANGIINYSGHDTFDIQPFLAEEKEFKPGTKELRNPGPFGNTYYWNR